MDKLRFIEDLNNKKNIAYKELYNRYYSHLCNYSSKIIGDYSTAEDVVQNCLLKLYKSDIKIKNIQILVAYLYKSVYNRSINYIRNQISSKNINSKWSENLIINEQDAKMLALKEEVISRLYSILNKLPEKQQEVILLSISGNGISEIAKRMNISENSVKTHKKRAYANIRKFFDKDSRHMLLIILFKSKDN